MKTNEVSELLSKHHAENDNKPSGTHAPRVERRIRFIKDKLRIILQGLPYNVTRNLLKWAAQCACRMTNMQPSSSSPDNLTPREKFLRRHTNYVTDIGPAFGTYVQCTVPNTNNTMESRTEAFPELSNNLRQSQQDTTTILDIQYTVHTVHKVHTYIYHIYMVYIYPICCHPG